MLHISLILLSILLAEQFQSQRYTFQNNAYHEWSCHRKIFAWWANNKSGSSRRFIIHLKLELCQNVRIQHILMRFLRSTWSWIFTLWSRPLWVWCPLAVQRFLDCGSLLCPSTPDARFNAPNWPWCYHSPHYGNTQKILGWRTSVFERWIRWFGSKKTAGAALQAAGTTC